MYLEDFALAKEKSVLKATVSVLESIIKGAFLEPVDKTSLVAKTLLKLGIESPKSILVFISKKR